MDMPQDFKINISITKKSDDLSEIIIELIGEPDDIANGLMLAITQSQVMEHAMMHVISGLAGAGIDKIKELAKEHNIERMITKGKES